MKIIKGDFVLTHNDLAKVVNVFDDDLLVDNNVNKYKIRKEDVYEVY